MKAKPSAVSQVAFQGSSFPRDSNGIASFSSRGPNRDFALKSDLAAAGTNVYMATQSVNGKGERLTSDFAVWQGKALDWLQIEPTLLQRRDLGYF